VLKKIRLVRVAVKPQKVRLQVVAVREHMLETRFVQVSKVVSFHS
jgi:hypothetical protein